MNDVEFCKEFVIRMVALFNGKLKTKTLIELKRIVIDKVAIPVENMWDDLSLLQLEYIDQNDRVLGFVYKFVRDNQDFFIK